MNVGLDTEAPSNAHEGESLTLAQWYAQAVSSTPAGKLIGRMRCDGWKCGLLRASERNDRQTQPQQVLALISCVFLSV
jgi:hypothetical protein